MPLADTAGVLGRPVAPFAAGAGVFTGDVFGKIAFVFIAAKLTAEGFAAFVKGWRFLFFLTAPVASC